MARKRSGPRRDASAIANRSRLSEVVSPVIRVSPVDLSLFEDRRFFHPEQAQRPALTFSGRPARITVVDRPPSKRARARGFKFQPMQTKATVAFDDPDRVLVCVRREQRREVLFAKGKGGGGHRRPRRSWKSFISCRRG